MDTAIHAAMEERGEETTASFERTRMSSNHHHLTLELPQTWSWSSMAADHHHQQCCQDYGHHSHPRGPPPGEEDQMQHHRELLFEKPLTPSDVGKLNRLVIPKQHAERHFPLNGQSGEKGLLLSFEDECGKHWRFRYSYWTSSQSYVLTKGWSRFVKDKRLDAGDVVLFERRTSDADRLYIRWKRRGVVAAAGHGIYPHAAPWNPVQFLGTPRVYYCPHQNPAASYELPHGSGGEVAVPDKEATMPAASSWTATSTNSKRLRLFGVNLDCGAESTDAMAPHCTTDEFGHRRVVELQLLPCNDGFPSPRLL